MITVTSMRTLAAVGGGAILAGTGAPNAMLEKNGAGRVPQMDCVLAAATGMPVVGTKALELFI